MTYKEALALEHGDEVIVSATGAVHRVESMKGTLKTLFVLLTTGEEYRHDLLERKTDE